MMMPDGTEKLLYCNYYNSTDNYRRFFYYKIPDGLFIYGYNKDFI